MKLTEVTFWDDYWANVQLPSTVNLDFSFERCLVETLKNNLSGIGGEVLEVGCAPGKWLDFMAKEFGLKPNGIEYSEAGVNATLRNFQLIGLDPGTFLAGDFFQMKPDRQFDVVMSFGFIEHFTNADEVVKLHLLWLKPGGTLILGVPNFRGIYFPIQRILDKELLDKHNLNIMNLEYFAHLSDRFNLEPIFLDYIGSFEPALPISKPGVENPLQFITKSFLWVGRRVRKIKIFDAINSRLFSSYIVGIYNKKDGNN